MLINMYIKNMAQITTQKLKRCFTPKTYHVLQNIDDNINELKVTIFVSQ